MDKTVNIVAAFVVGVGLGVLVMTYRVATICKERSKWTATVWSMKTKIPMPEYYRQTTGYDSIQLLCGINGENLRANFCHSNKWQSQELDGRIDSGLANRIDRIVVTNVATGLTRYQLDSVMRADTIWLPRMHIRKTIHLLGNGHTVYIFRDTGR